MGFITWVVLIAGFWATAIIAQKACLEDSHCMGNQYCYKPSETCVNYTLCSRYNRKENSKRSREPIECSDCIEGYFAEKQPDSDGEADSCTRKDPNVVEQKDNQSVWIWLGVSGIFIVISLYLIQAIIRCKPPCKGESAPEPEKPNLLMAENGVCASAPPAPLSQNLNNNNYHDAEETNPLSNTREYHGNFAVDTSHPVKAQGYHPPDNVRTDPSYNPGDTQVAETTFSPPDVEEETIPSSWTPGPQTGGIPAQPFAAISQAVQENAANTARQRLACPSPSTSQEDQGNRQNNNSSENSGFDNNDRNGNNTRGNNSNPSRIVQFVQVMNIVNPGGNGS